MYGMNLTLDGYVAAAEATPADPYAMPAARTRAATDFATFVPIIRTPFWWSYES